MFDYIWMSEHVSVYEFIWVYPCAWVKVWTSWCVSMFVGKWICEHACLWVCSMCACEWMCESYMWAYLSVHVCVSECVGIFIPLSEYVTKFVWINDCVSRMCLNLPSCTLLWLRQHAGLFWWAIVCMCFLAQSGVIVAWVSCQLLVTNSRVGQVISKTDCTFGPFLSLFITRLLYFSAGLPVPLLPF